MSGPADLPTALAQGPANLEAAAATAMRLYLLREVGERRRG